MRSPTVGVSALLAGLENAAAPRASAAMTTSPMIGLVTAGPLIGSSRCRSSVGRRGCGNGGGSRRPQRRQINAQRQRQLRGAVAQAARQCWYRARWRSAAAWPCRACRPSTWASAVISPAMPNQGLPGTASGFQPRDHRRRRQRVISEAHRFDQRRIAQRLRRAGIGGNGIEQLDGLGGIAGTHRIGGLHHLRQRRDSPGALLGERIEHAAAPWRYRRLRAGQRPGRAVRRRRRPVFAWSSRHHSHAGNGAAGHSTSNAMPSLP